MQLSNFTLSMEQVKTPIEKWCYFLKHGTETHCNSDNQHDLKKMIGDDAIFKRAYEEFHQVKKKVELKKVGLKFKKAALELKKVGLKLKKAVLELKKKV